MKKTTHSNYLEQPIQDYLDFLHKTTKISEGVVKKEHVLKNLDKYGNMINTFLTYPDILIDLITPRNNKFSLFFSQRMVLRAMARSRQSFFTFSRGYSKSFLAFTNSYLRTMLVPRHKSFVNSGSKEQTTQIAKEKIQDDLWVRFPLLQNEMKKIRVSGRYERAFVRGQNYAEFRFSHGGIFDVVGGTIRGFRRNSGIFEEVIELDPKYTNEVVIPLLNKPREDAFGEINPKEPHGSKVFITTAGYQGTYAYQKLLETLCLSVIDPENYTVLGGSYELSVIHGLIQERTIRELISSPSYNRDSFEREYMSVWSGAPKGAVFSANTIARLRKVVRAESKADNSENGNFFYVVCADMAKDGSASTVAVVLKVRPKEYFFSYSLVNLFRIDTTDYEKISNVLKETAQRYKARMLVYDANGIGAAIRDWLNKDSYYNGTLLKGLGIINPPPKSEKDVIKWPNNRTICYEIKATGQKGDEIHKLFFSRISNGSIKFLLKSSDAISRMEKIDNFRKANNRIKERKIRPYLFMDEMERELTNLEIIDVSDNINSSMRIRRKDNQVQKDFFSATEYAVYAVNNHIELEYYKKRKRTVAKASDFVLVT